MALAHVLADPEQILAMSGLSLATLLLFGWLALFVCALFSIVLSPHTGGMKLAWLVFAFVAPFLGCLLWFVVGRGDAYRRRAF
ncbi:PLD nuclease N-terminal domain-containing protein [Saccharopolyspora shandongensis]|uniref:PLD nuclease N-terminal domain-containing protein n=1 Tax=Saccharopolyspora shandongensis TaxID=418495 RepID=UPI0033C76B5A